MLGLRQVAPGFFCPKCGTPNKLAARFCRHCGHKRPEPKDPREPRAKAASALERLRGCMARRRSGGEHRSVGESRGSSSDFNEPLEVSIETWCEPPPLAHPNLAEVCHGIGCYGQASNHNPNTTVCSSRFSQ